MCLIVQRASLVIRLCVSLWQYLWCRHIASFLGVQQSRSFCFVLFFIFISHFAQQSTKIVNQMNKMRDDQEFNINFVKIVQKYRCLFDKTMPEYRSKDDHERIWNKVAQEAKESGKFRMSCWAKDCVKITCQPNMSHFAACLSVACHWGCCFADRYCFWLPNNKSCI